MQANLDTNSRPQTFDKLTVKNATMFGQFGRVVQEKLSETISVPSNMYFFFHFSKVKH